MKLLPWVVGGLWVAGVLQAGAAPHMAILGAQPDFLLVFAISFSLYLNRGGAAATGFYAGLIQGGLIGANLTHYIASRMISCFAASWSRRLRFEMTPATIAGTVFATTILASLIFMFTAAPRNLGGFLRDTIVAATYNGVLALPLYGLLSRVLPQPSRRRI